MKHYAQFNIIIVELTSINIVLLKYTLENVNRLQTLKKLIKCL